MGRTLGALLLLVALLGAAAPAPPAPARAAPAGPGGSRPGRADAAGQPRGHPGDDDQHPGLAGCSTCWCRCSSAASGYQVKTDLRRDGAGAGAGRARRGRRGARPRARRRAGVDGGGQRYERLLVMHNDFVHRRPGRTIRRGCAARPDRGRGAAAHRRRRGRRSSRRGDNSGTAQLEQAIWQGAGLDAAGQPGTTRPGRAWARR